MADRCTIEIGQLRVGMYVRLNLRWYEHPFARSDFKIKSVEQIETIRGLGLRNVVYDPALSDIPAPLPQPPASPPTPPAATAISQTISNALAVKQEMIERIRVQRGAATRVENAFVDSAKAVLDIEKELEAKPEEAVKQANYLVSQIADSLLGSSEMTIHVMGDKSSGEEIYSHALNVATFSLILARELGLPKELFPPLGMGALMHDIGKKDIPTTILLKRELLTSAEQHLLEMHCEYGVAIGQHLQLPPQALSIIAEHHEYHDGSGYPRKLKAEAIGLLSHIVALSNHYDNLCNPPNVTNALTPHEALAQMFSRQRNKFDPRILQVFIRCLGVYPPGTIVELSDGSIGMVATVNPKKPIKPLVVVYDAGIPKEAALLVDLAEDGELNITRGIRPAMVPQAIRSYLSPRQRVSYYFDTCQPKPEKDPQA